jgi:glycosyltransferase involved in cell wall biosynthesis
MKQISTVSIALCTHNGGEFLNDQLKSIQYQSLQPNEIIICDDNSSDNTLEIISQFSDKLPIKLFQNIPALGTIKNFEYAISLCSNEIIFLCDQDDYWLHHKVETLVNYLAENITQEVVFSNAVIVDNELQDLQTTMWEKVRFWEEEIEEWKRGNALDLLLTGNRVTGCTVAMRKNFAEKSRPFPTNIHPNFIHDGWIGILASLNNMIGFVNEPLVLYRQHEQQQVGVIEKEREKIHVHSRFSRSRDLKLEPFIEKGNLYYNLLNHININYPELKDKTKPLQRISQHYQLRSNLAKNRFKRIVPIFKNLYSGNYHRYRNLGSNWYGVYLAVLGDLLE